MDFFCLYFAAHHSVVLVQPKIRRAYANNKLPHANAPAFLFNNLLHEKCIHFATHAKTTVPIQPQAPVDRVAAADCKIKLVSARAQIATAILFVHVMEISTATSTKMKFVRARMQYRHRHRRRRLHRHPCRRARRKIARTFSQLSTTSRLRLLVHSNASARVWVPELLSRLIF